MMKFEQLGLAEPLVRAVAAEGYTVPTPIQVKAIPLVLEGKDLFGCAQTGTGKTAAFALPILHRLTHGGTAAPRTHAGAYGHPKNAPQIRALVLSPTRELATQIAESFRAYGRHTGLRASVIFGGVNQHHQVRALKHGIDILVATPGRLLDLMTQGFVDLRQVEVFVLDEADRMLDMGFIHDIRKIEARVPKQRQTLMFSATMPDDIRQLAHKMLRHPVNVEVTPAATTVERVEQRVYFVPTASKPQMLRHFLEVNSITRALVFTRTKHGADKVVKHLHHSGIHAEAIHGNKSQNARQRALENFRTRRTPVLVATDIAARGIDIDDISHVVNYDMPNVPETYVHRIGRTARAGASGQAVSFCDVNERPHLKSIERLTRLDIQVARDVPAFAREKTSARIESGSDDSDGRSAARFQGKHKTPRRPANGQHVEGRHHGGHQTNGHAPTRKSHAPKSNGHTSRRGHDAVRHATASPKPRGLHSNGRGRTKSRTF